MALAVGDIGLAVIRQKLHGQVVLNTLHYRIVEFVAGSFNHSIASLAAGVALKFVPNLKAVQSNELAHEGVMAQKIRPLPPEMAVVNTVQNGTGSVAVSSLPTSMSLTITETNRFAGSK